MVRKWRVYCRFFGDGLDHPERRFRPFENELIDALFVSNTGESLIDFHIHLD